MSLPRKQRLALELLVESGEAYGLELVERSAGALKRGTVYVVLHQLAGKGLAESRDEPAQPGSSGPPRRVFRPTALGRRAQRAQAQLERLLLEAAP